VGTTRRGQPGRPVPWFGRARCQWETDKRNSGQQGPEHLSILWPPLCHRPYRMRRARSKHRGETHVIGALAAEGAKRLRGCHLKGEEGEQQGRAADSRSRVAPGVRQSEGITEIGCTKDLPNGRRIALRLCA
jgi:hypothetical protein